MIGQALTPEIRAGLENLDMLCPEELTDYAEAWLRGDKYCLHSFHQRGCASCLMRLLYMAGKS